MQTFIDKNFYLKKAREKLNSYLYPSIIEYSLLSMTVFYILWKSIDGGLIKSPHSSTIGIEMNECDESATQSNVEAVELSKSKRTPSMASEHKRNANQFTGLILNKSGNDLKNRVSD